MIERRQFFAVSALTAAAARRVAGANDRIGIGLIGCGDRGVRALLRETLEFREQAEVEVRAVCDIWKRARENAVAAVRQAVGSPPAEDAAYRELLARKEVDAVIIATPDHQHATILTDAVHAGKDAYVEKPLAMDMRELTTCYDAVKRSDRVVQMGTQIRSLPSSMAAKQFVASGGLGQVFKVEQERNSVRPYWHRYGERSIEESETDWKAFLMNRRARPWDPDQYLAWYGYREFSRGPHTNLMVHFIDLVHHITGAGPPSRVVTLGGTYRFKDARTAPDSVEAILDYPDAGFLVRYSTAFGTSAGNYLKFFGTKGVLDAANWSGKPFPISGEGSDDSDRIAAGAAIPEVASDPHMLNWLKCLRTRSQPNAPIEAGYSHGVAVILADEALVRGRRMVYDASRRAIREG